MVQDATKIYSWSNKLRVVTSVPLRVLALSGGDGVLGTNFYVKANIYLLHLEIAILEGQLSPDF